MAAAMEHKSAQFLEQFSVTLFAQWQQTEEKERFWLNASFLHDLLEEAVAKLPKISLKGHLARELSHGAGVLKNLLEKQYVAYQKSNAVKKQKKYAYEYELLSEQDVERAVVTTTDADKRRALAAILALDEYDEITTKDAGVSVEQVEEYVQQLQRISARRYESSAERSRKRGFYVQRITQCAQQLLAKWSADNNGNWNCTPSAANSKELQQLRAALQRLVSSDAASETSNGSSGLLPSPWTSFYRPSESSQFQKIDYEAEIAKIYGVLLTLAVYFPIVLEDDDEAQGTSDESSDDDDGNETSAAQQTSTSRKVLDFAEQAKQTVRHVVFATKKRDDALWLISVLTFVHNLPKPKTYRDEDDDDELALDAEDQRALQDCLSDVYSRAFANPDVWENNSRGGQEADKNADWLLFEAILCIRHAAHFMRVERRQSIPAVTTAMVKLVSIPLSPSFWKWSEHVKKTHFSQSPVVREAMKKLAKSKTTKTASALLSASEITDDELKVVAENYGAYLRTNPDDKYIAPARVQSTGVEGEEPEEAAAVEGTGSLFFVDSAGGKKTDNTATGKRKQSNGGAKSRAAKQKKVA
uniref:Uncharacterized protein n=1 Tax=Globisporangium ultimum (strain ATCC 200006 / CBS 805.95 / DAOM BR144) TaxID=431595 RepID=K3WE03_GLOUD